MLGADATTAPLGRLSELMGRSAGHVAEYYNTLICLLLLPFEIIASIIILYYFVGPSGFGGLGVMIVSYSPLYRHTHTHIYIDIYTYKAYTYRT